MALHASSSARRVVRVLIVDDSALVRRVLSDALSAQADIDVIGTASDAFEARERIIALHPDVITLDLDMPRMNGLTFLAKLMQHVPLPVVVVSAGAYPDSEIAQRALALGAVSVMVKPASPLAVGDIAGALATAVRLASHARVAHGVRAARDGRASDRGVPGLVEAPQSLIALGASTGGTHALETVLRKFPEDAPGTVMVQHMPENFTASFAKRLNSVCAMRVQEAADGDVVVPGLALVAPGGKHLIIQAAGTKLVARVKDGPKVHHQRPAVDVLFHSVARCAGANAASALLTGMGADGAKGLLAMRDAGAYTLAQDEATCAVFGMPREAARLNAACDVLPLDRIATALLRAVRLTSV